jgi:hypothetical protein
MGVMGPFTPISADRGGPAIRTDEADRPVTVGRPILTDVAAVEVADAPAGQAAGRSAGVTLAIRGAATSLGANWPARWQS